MLEAIRFVNCQSFEDITIDFATDKTNVLIAENNTGKSILFKMLKVTANPNYFPAKKRNMLIRRGALSASMICAFTDGCLGMTTITEKGVIYRWKNSEDEAFSSYAEPPQIYLDELGLIVDQKSKFIANIVDTDQDMLLVNSDQKGNHELLRLLAEDQTVIDTKEKIARELSYFKRYNSDLIAKQVDLRNSLESLEIADVNSLQYEYNTGQLLYTELYKLIELSDSLEVIQEFCELSFNYSFCIDLIDILLLLQRVEVLLGQIVIEKEISEDIIRLVSILTQLSDILSDVQVIKEIGFAPETLDKVLGIADALSNIQIITLDKGLELSEIMLNCNKVIAKLNSIGHFQREMLALDSDIFQTLETIKASKCVVNCPVHGEVIYDGKECLPYNI